MLLLGVTVWRAGAGVLDLYRIPFKIFHRHPIRHSKNCFVLEPSLADEREQLKIKK